MPAFTEIDFRRFDVWAILTDGGVTVIDPAQRDASREWLASRGYAITTVDFGGGVAAGAAALGQLFHWEEQFGYRYGGDRLSLDALRDGFGFGLDPDRGNVLECVGVDAAYRDDPAWTLGLLAIAHEHCVNQLAIGRRFFIVLVLDSEAPIVGQPYETKRVPRSYNAANASSFVYPFR
jgi:hypothetical protein